jgi:hypothetical protein
MKAWHFLNYGMRLGYGDNRPVEVRKTLTITGEPRLCERGLHASERLIDALKYAQKPLISRVRLGGTIVKGDDKLVASERTTLWVLDCEKILHEFACRCAVRALKKAKVTDPRCYRAIEVKRLWLDWKATTEELKSARDAATAAASAYAAAADAAYAAYAAAADAAYAAASAYAADAAYAAASAAASAAAYAAYAAAARNSERNWQNRILTNMILRAHKARE